MKKASIWMILFILLSVFAQAVHEETNDEELTEKLLESHGVILPNNPLWAFDLLFDEIALRTISIFRGPEAAADYALKVSEERTAEVVNQALALEQDGLERSLKARESKINNTERIINRSTIQEQERELEHYIGYIERQDRALQAVRVILTDRGNAAENVGGGRVLSEQFSEANKGLTVAINTDSQKSTTAEKTLNDVQERIAQTE